MAAFNISQRLAICDNPQCVAEMLMSKDPAQLQAATSQLHSSRALLVSAVHELYPIARGPQITQALAAAGALFKLDRQFIEVFASRETDPPGLIALTNIGRQALLSIHPSLRPRDLNA